MKKVFTIVIICFLFIACNIGNNEILSEKMVGLKVIQEPRNSIYYVNENLDLSGLIINAVFADGSEKEVKGYTLSIEEGAVLKELGRKDILISYNNFSCKISVNVYEEGHSFAGIYEKGHIGQTINLLKAKSLIPETKFNTIFDLERLYCMKPYQRNKNTQMVETVGDSNFKGLSKQVKSSLNKKISNAGDMSVIGIPGMIFSGLNSNNGIRYNNSYKTEEYYCKTTYKFEEEEIGLDNYYNSSAFTPFLTDEFKQDASLVGKGEMSAKSFIEKYGTNVIMSSIIGASYNVLCHISTTDNDLKSELNSKLKSKIESSIFKSTSEGTKLDSGILRNQDTWDTASYFKAESFGGSIFNFSTGKSAREGFNQWKKSIKADNTSIIDVPDESLLFVWDLLDNSFYQTKQVLYEYFVSECEGLYEKLISTSEKFKTKDTFSFDEINNVVVIDLDYFYDNTIWEDLNYSYFEDGVLTVMPKYNYVPVSKVIIKGQYGARNKNGIITEDIITGLSIKLSDRFYSDKVEIQLENIGIIGKENFPVIDLTGCTGIDEVEIKILGKTYLSSNGSSPVINADCKQTLITSEDDKQLVEICGGNGSQESPNGGNGIVAKSMIIKSASELHISGGAGYKGKNGADGYGGNRGTKGEDGGNGGNGIKCTMLTITYPTSEIYISGGNGGQGGSSGESKLGGIKLGEKGVDGADGGDGGSCIVTQSTPVIDATVYYTPGSGASGGTGGAWGGEWAVGCYPGDNGSYGSSGANIQIQ